MFGVTKIIFGSISFEELVPFTCTEIMAGDVYPLAFFFLVFFFLLVDFIFFLIFDLCFLTFFFKTKQNIFSIYFFVVYHVSRKFYIFEKYLDNYW